MEWHSFPLLALYRLVQGQLILLLERTSDLDNKATATIVDDILLRQKFWAEDIGLENGALKHLEANDGQAACVMRLYLSDFLNVLLVDIEQAMTTSSYEFSLTKMGENLSLLCELNESLCNQVEIFDAISASQTKGPIKSPRGLVEVAEIRCDLEEMDSRSRVKSGVMPDLAPVQTSILQRAGKPMEKAAFDGLSFVERPVKLIIGLDFGTTYSGVAYLFTGVGKSEPIVVTEWPGAEGANKSKVPTLIQYENPPQQALPWGYELALSSANDRNEGIKLLLDLDHSKPLHVPQFNTKAELQRLGKPAIDVAVDYIATLYKYASHRIEADSPENYLSTQQRKFVLSVPAFWSDGAKNGLMRAAKKAGIHPITLIKEPEAAATYVLHNLKDKDLKAGDAFVFCNAGGGTVDLISYEITELDPLELKELVPGSSALDGSLMINKRFEETIKNAVGPKQYRKLRKDKSYPIAMQYFENYVKPNFTSHEDEVYSVKFPKAGLTDDPHMNIASDCFNVTRDILLDIFQPSIAKINDLVKAQVESVRTKRRDENHTTSEVIKAIFLVGGFGSSNYLRECLRKLHPDIEIIHPTDAWSAVVRGAVLSQAPGEAVIASTVATRNYGFTTATPDDIGPRDPDKIEWYIRMGENLQREPQISVPFYHTLRKHYTEDQLLFKHDLIESESIKPPIYPYEGSTTVNCLIIADFRGVPKLNLKRLTGKDGRIRYELHYNLNIKFESAVMTFSSEIDGKEMGVVKAKYN